MEKKDTLVMLAAGNTVDSFEVEYQIGANAAFWHHYSWVF